MKAALLRALLGTLLIAGCATAPPAEDTAIPRVQAPTAADLEREREERWEAKGKDAIAAEYRAFLKAPVACERSDWARYNEAAELTKVAKDYALPSPWDAAFGSDYARRKMPAGLNVREMVFKAYWAYVEKMPEPAMAMHQTSEVHGAEQKAVFNEMVRRDFECFRKLK